MPQKESTPASRIFVSYRREDTSGHVLALIPRLREHFGADRVFKDTDSIAPGQDFMATIQKELESCAVLLAIIGKHWLSVQDPRLGKRRLDDPEDFLRLEVGTALRKPDILVIPVLVGHATMPRVEDLPPDLANLARRNAIELSDTRWDSDLDRLVRAVEEVVGRQPVSAAQQAIAEARQDFDRGRHAYAIERLEQFTPQTPVVTYALRSLREDWERIKSSRGQVDDLLHKATRAMEDGAFAVAIGRLTEAARIEPGREDIQSLLQTAEDAQKRREETERAREEIEAPLRDARQKLREKKFDTARQLVATVRQRDPDNAELTELAQEIDDVEASLVSIASAQASFESKDFESTIVYADRALLLDPLSKDAKALKKRSLQAMQARNPADVQRKEFVKELEPIGVAQQSDSYARRYRKMRRWLLILIGIMIAGAVYSFLPKPDHVKRLTAPAGSNDSAQRSPP
jgi:tetratricopeptide (TPR) repeat protein